MAYGDFVTRLENGESVVIPVDELVRIIASGYMPDGSTFAGIKISSATVSGSVTVTAVTLPTTVVHGQKTVAAAGTEEALGASTTLTSGVRVKALHANTGYVYVGKNPVTSTTGYVLAAGEEVFVEVSNLATVYVDVSVNGEGVSYIGG